MAKARVMAPKEPRAQLTVSDIKEGKWYRGKNPKTIRGRVNDRLVIHISSSGYQVQYDSSAVKDGRHYPMVSIRKFLAWASHEVFNGDTEPKPSMAEKPENTGL